MTRKKTIASTAEEKRLILSDPDQVAAYIYDHLEDILTRWIEGERLSHIEKSLPFDKYRPGRMMRVIMASEKAAYMYLNARAEKAAHMVEDAVDWAKDAAATGDSSGLKVGIETYMKLAGKLDPENYGDKSRVELTGKNGGAVRVENMTDDMLLSIAAQGVKAE